MFYDFLTLIFDGISDVYLMMSDIELMVYKGQTITLLDVAFSVFVLWGVLKVFFGDLDLEVSFDDDDD